MAEARRDEACRNLEVDLPRRLQGFADAMRLGAVQLVARQLLRAGVFRASLDLDRFRDVGAEAAVEAVGRAAAARPRLQEFMRGYWKVIAEQAVYVTPESVLPKRVVNRERWREQFGGFLERSLDAAERWLDQLEALEKRLPVWKSVVRGADVPRVEPVMDVHDSET